MKINTFFIPRHSETEGYTLLNLNITISQGYGRNGNIGEHPRNILHNLRLWLDIPNYVSKYSSIIPTNEAHRQRIENKCIAAEQIEIEERKNFCANEVEDLLKILDPPVKRQVFLAIIDNPQQQNNFVRGWSSLPDDPNGVYMTRLTIPPEKIFVYDPGDPSIGIIPCLIPLIYYLESNGYSIITYNELKQDINSIKAHNETHNLSKKRTAFFINKGFE
jgi:hypothetical protein